MRYPFYDDDKCECRTKTDDISDSLVIREDNLSLVTLKNGDMPMGHDHGYGLYYRDCRFLSGYVIKLNDEVLTSILSSDSNEYASTVIMTNKSFKDHKGVIIEKDTLAVRRDRVIPGLVDENILISNYNRSEVKTDLTLLFESDFYDIFTVRGITKKTEVRLSPPEYHNGKLIFSYHGKDGHIRNTRIAFDPSPSRVEGGLCNFELKLKPRTAREIALRIQVEDISPHGDFKPDTRPIKERIETIERSYRSTKECCGIVGTDNEIFNKISLRSLSDLRLLNMSLHNQVFYSAGVPWYDTLFGRDSIIAAIQSMIFEPAMAKSTIMLLAHYQAKGFDDWRDAEPGKILHELRLGEKANLGEIPQTPYYGSVDSTLLFLILLAEYVDWTGDMSLMLEYMDNVYAAIEWIDKYSDPGQMGFVSYSRRSSRGLYNQGWKDSFDSISHSDGSLAEKPVAPSEIQGYAYMAMKRISGIFKHIGKKEEAHKLKKYAEKLKREFNKRFWMRDKRYYAQAIDNKGLCDVISSNPLQCLWSEIIDRKKATDMVQRMFEPDMFTGWGIRTLSSNEERYNPLGYHTGTVWPFDNSIIALGLCKYEFKNEASILFTGMYEAASYYTGYRLPELFAGFQREKQNMPVKYPVACNPQAWSAGSIPFMLTAMLGISPHAIDNSLTLVRPELPPWLNNVRINGLKIGGKSVDLEFKREAGVTMVDVLKTEGLDVNVHY